MAGSKSNYLEDALNDHVLGGGSYTRPGTVYVALFTARGTNTQSDAGTNFTEVSGGSYARAAVTNNATNFPASSGGVKSNGTTITFPQATASWGTVVAFGIYDAASVGNLLYWADLDVNKTIDSGDTASFAAGTLTITEE